MSNTKPYVQAACLCESVLQEGTTPSLIRLIDTFTIHVPNDLPPEVRGVVKLTVFVSLKAGSLTGSHRLGLVLRFPTVQPHVLPDAKIVMQAGVSGHYQIYNINLAIEELGEHQFDVLWDDEPLTSIPFRLVAAPDEQSGPKTTH